jgi:hypothetical protein
MAHQERAGLYDEDESVTLRGFTTEPRGPTGAWRPGESLERVAQVGECGDPGSISETTFTALVAPLRSEGEHGEEDSSIARIEIEECADLTDIEV